LGVCAPMDDVEPRAAEYYRDKAAEIRIFARRANSPEVARELLYLACCFDRMAEYVERRTPWPALDFP
jgi:hypothetical protein